MPKLSEPDEMTIVRKTLERRDDNPNYVQEAVDYMTKLKAALPELISMILPDGIKTITDFLEKDNWSINMTQEHMSDLQLNELSLYAKRLPALDLFATYLAQKVLREDKDDAGDVAALTHMATSLIADYVIRIMVAFDPSIFDKALELKDKR